MGKAPISNSSIKANPPWQEMVAGASATTKSSTRGPTPKISHENSKESDNFKTPLSHDPQVRLAIYIAMAHAGLALTLALLYGLTKLLEECYRPIQWAILCSMPLREIQRALVQFWRHPLNLGLFETLLAIPVAVFSAITGTVIDFQGALFRLLRIRQQSSESKERIGFSKLMQWLVSFGLFVFTHERIGASVIPAFAFSGLIAYAAGSSAGLMDQTHGKSNVASTLTAISSVRRGRSTPMLSVWSRFSRFLTSGLLKRLKTMVALGLITGMIAGLVCGFMFFSYKIGVEGKDAVISLKTHLQENNYAERIGLMEWIEKNDIPELIDTYTAKFYETLSQQVDSLALHYNVTEIVDGFKYYLMKPSESSVTSTVPVVSGQPFGEKLHNLQVNVQNREWQLIYHEVQGVFREFMVLLRREDLVEKIKRIALQSVDMSKRVLASSSVVLAGSANLLFSLAVSIVSGAAGVLNFVSQLMVFFWLLYYLITSESGGVMDHVLGMLPVSEATRVRSAEVLGHAVSSVLLATAKITLFQGCLTYLLFRFYRIHFLYMSTVLAFMSALLPFIPTWVSSVPAAAQLGMEGRYVEAIVLTVIHLMLMDYGASAIQDDIPGQRAYLTGLSILGGMALFPSALEGTIMGPMLMTVMIALKNLYAEFVLVSTKETSSLAQKYIRLITRLLDFQKPEAVINHSVPLRLIESKHKLS
ncbi:hypothetical protein AMTR_s00049p00202870 [Amborella trichopoda]|uniref:Transmembrane protein 245 n=1 Tax=Amborella trichopoda TaxID=13333 RepID=W1Q000_AMBTC|nr:hypothetical protein AMTR_s00049p00202870 [Amborella trichopoda]